jgi:ligand-binding sensor domain-containing protein
MCAFDVALLLEDRAGNFWFSTNGYGICRYNPVTGVFTNFTKEHGLGSNYVQCMLEDKAGNLWFGERAGGVCRFDSASDRFTSVNGKGCLSSQIMEIVEDKTGNIWFANLYSGLCRYSSASGDFTQFTEQDGICGDVVTCLYEDTKGNLWFGSNASKLVTGGGGLCRYDPSASLSTGKSFTGFTTKDGLDNTDVWCIVEDTAGDIWVGTRNGLYRYHSPSARFINYTHKVNSSSN